MPLPAPERKSTAHEYRTFPLGLPPVHRGSLNLRAKVLDFVQFGGAEETVGRTTF